MIHYNSRNSTAELYRSQAVKKFVSRSVWQRDQGREKREEAHSDILAGGDVGDTGGMRVV